MFRQYHLLLLFCCLGWTVYSQGQESEKLAKEIQKIIDLEPTLRMENIPFCLIGVIQQDSTYLFAREDEEVTIAQKSDATSIFELGGLSKVFTASLAEILATEGKISLDSTVNSFLPKAYRNPRMNQLTLLQLLTHASGLPKMPVEFGALEIEANNPYANYSKTDLLLFYRDYFPEKGPAKYRYSHVNYALLEIIMELKTKRSFDFLLYRKLLNPLGMQHTFVEAKDSLQLLPGYSIGGQPSPAWSFPSFAGAEGVKSSMGDLLHFARVNLSKTADPLSPILLKTQKKYTITDYSKQAFSGKGWHVIEKKRFYPILVHTGNTNGFRAFMAFVPQTQTAVIILSNSEQATGGLGFLILRMINHNFKKKKMRKRKE